MEEFINCYLPLIFGVIFAYCVFKAAFFNGEADDSSCSYNRRCNNNQENTKQSKYTTYTIIDSKTTSPTKL